MAIMSVWETIFSSESFWALLSTIVTGLFGILFHFLRKAGIEKEAIDSLRNAVASVQDEYVTFWKRAAADGKLTEEERRKAREMALNRALELSKGPVLKLLLSWGKPKIESVITRIVQGDKKK